MSTRNAQAHKPSKARAGAYTHTKAPSKAKGTTVTTAPPQAPQAPQPAAVLPFPDRRQTPRRRASDRMPVVDAETLQRAILRAVIQVVTPSQVDALMPPAPRPLQGPPGGPTGARSAGSAPAQG